jgi:hypothetical protein
LGEFTLGGTGVGIVPKVLHQRSLVGPVIETLAARIGSRLADGRVKLAREQVARARRSAAREYGAAPKRSAGVRNAGARSAGGETNKRDRRR